MAKFVHTLLKLKLKLNNCRTRYSQYILQHFENTNRLNNQFRKSV